MRPNIRIQHIMILLRKMILIYKKHLPCICIHIYFELIRLRFALIRLRFALIRTSYTFIRENFALIRESYQFIRESFVVNSRNLRVRFANVTRLFAKNIFFPLRKWAQWDFEVKGIQLSSNEGQHLYSRGENNRKIEKYILTIFNNFPQKQFRPIL